MPPLRGQLRDGAAVLIDFSLRNQGPAPPLGRRLCLSEAATDETSEQARRVEELETELRHLREDLRESEQFNTRILEASRDCVKVLDLEGRLLSMNKGGMEMLEICDFGPLKNSYWIDFWEGNDRAAAKSAVEAAREGGMGRFVGFFPTTQTRKPMWFDVVVSPILAPDGKPERLVALSRDVTERKRAEDMLRTITEGTSSVTGKEFFRCLVQHLAMGLMVRYAFLAECRDRKHARSVAFWEGSGFGENFEYDVAGTPCNNVLEGRTCFYPNRLQALFPEDVGLASWQAESYLGVPLLDSMSRIIGHLVILNDRPMEQDPLLVSVLETFASRAGAELERQEADDKLRAAMAEVESLKNRLQAENLYLQEEIRTEHNFEEIVGNSPPLLAALSQVEHVASTDSTVLLMGETGTGKELFARAIHSRSARRERPLVKVNCGAIPAGLVESELFGHVRGAFTGALEKRVGRFELANGGTIFLDEVSELPLETQVKLLRVLQEKEFEPVGGSRTVRVNVRVLAASNRELEEAVSSGAFRADLFYRLNVFPIRVPALRQRRGDIPLLVTFFLGSLSKQLGKRLDGVSRASMDRLTAYPWPGNVRELQNVVERAAILARGPILEIEQDMLAPSKSGAVEADGSRTLEEIERSHIRAALKSTGGVVEGPRGAANILGIHPNTLRSRIKRLGLDRVRSHEIS
ncbi:MAG TPA: sigma 54-interacting transcriptional regulator [Thermoanaerobaculia bacterium]|nr:sigma 54-interacting transcriptional regulator [Thermoanaerobaculia bacterium]